jgi:predicted AAA+ superfamily ATPase
LVYGGFPEPFFKGTTRFYNRWKKSPLDIILKQDLIDLERVQQIVQIETLIQLLKNSIGSPVSYSSLAQDLQCSDKTVKRWLTILENMYVIFRVPPFHKNIARAILMGMLCLLFSQAIQLRLPMRCIYPRFSWHDSLRNIYELLRKG